MIQFKLWYIVQSYPYFPICIKANLSMIKFHIISVYISLFVVLYALFTKVCLNFSSTLNLLFLSINNELSKIFNFYLRGKKIFAFQDAALAVFRKTQEKTVSLGHRLDLLFHIIRIGLFYVDHDLITRNIEKAKRFVQLLKSVTIQ